MKNINKNEISSGNLCTISQNNKLYPYKIFLLHIFAFLIIIYNIKL